MHDLSFTPETATEKQKCQCLKKVNNLITGSLEKGFFRLVDFHSFARLTAFT